MGEKFEERGADFLQIRDKLNSVLLSQPEAMIIVEEGVDDLCQQCFYNVDGRCASPQGNEDTVRKWDAILLKELGLSFGTSLSAAEWLALIERKIPFKICRKCQWKSNCSVGISLL